MMADALCQLAYILLGLKVIADESFLSPHKTVYSTSVLYCSYCMYVCMYVSQYVDPIVCIRSGGGVREMGGGGGD
jgi:hypothetical protein